MDDNLLPISERWWRINYYYLSHKDYGRLSNIIMSVAHTSHASLILEILGYKNEGKTFQIADINKKYVMYCSGILFLLPISYSNRGTPKV